MTTATQDNRRKFPARFDELSRRHPLRPIHDDDALETAQEVADHLAVLDRRTKDQEDYLQVLATLIEKYEEEHDEIDTSRLDPVGTLKYLMAENGMDRADLGRVLGHRSLGYAILDGRRGMSLKTIATLARHFHVGPDVFIKTEPSNP